MWNLCHIWLYLLTLPKLKRPSRVGGDFLEYGELISDSLSDHWIYLDLSGFGWFGWERVRNKWCCWRPDIVNAHAIMATIGWILLCMSFGSFARNAQWYISFGGVAVCRSRVPYRSTLMSYQLGISVMTGVNLIKNNLCLDSWICRWVRPAGATDISSIVHMEAFVTYQSSFIFGNGFFFFLFWVGLCEPIACSLLGDGSPSQNSGYRSTRLCPCLC